MLEGFWLFVLLASAALSLFLAALYSPGVLRSIGAYFIARACALQSSRAAYRSCIEAERNHLDMQYTMRYRELESTRYPDRGRNL